MSQEDRDNALRSIQRFFGTVRLVVVDVELMHVGKETFKYLEPRDLVRARFSVRWQSAS